MNLQSHKTKCDKCANSCEGGSIIARGEGYLNFCRVCTDILTSFPKEFMPISLEMFMKPDEILSKVDKNILRARRNRAEVRERDRIGCLEKVKN